MAHHDQMDSIDESALLGDGAHQAHLPGVTDAPQAPQVPQAPQAPQAPELASTAPQAPIAPPADPAALIFQQLGALTLAAALFGKRSTRFRHVYGLPAQKENCYDNIRVSGNAHDSMFCAVNRAYLAVVLESAGGGGFSVLPLQRTGRIDHNAPKICGHSAPVMDVKWNPFNDNIIASASDDATVKLWEIPQSGIRADITRWTMDMRAHSRRVAYLEWHPTASNILLSAGFDHAAIIWNCEIGSPVIVSRCHPDVILSLSWNRDGSLYATTCKDRTARVIDPRSGKPVLSFEAHQGAKTTKIVSLGDSKQLFTTGFSQFAQRQYGLWDMRNLESPIKIDNIDSASGALFPFYDHDTRMIYLAGKGDGNIRYFELTLSEPFVHYLSEYQSPHPQRGLGVMPKLGLDTSKCEIFRFYKLHSNRPYCEPISMIAPRKAETFQEDLYPPTAGDCPALSAIEWIGGMNRDPILVNIREPSVPVNNPRMVTSRPVQLNRLSSQSFTAPTNTENSSKARTPLNGHASGDIDEKTLPQSVRNIRKLVGNQAPLQPPADATDHHARQASATSKTDDTSKTANENVPVDGSNYNNNNNNSNNSWHVKPNVVNGESHKSTQNGDQHVKNNSTSSDNANKAANRLVAGPSQQSLGSDSVFERPQKKHEVERPPSPVGVQLAAEDRTQASATKLVVVRQQPSSQTGERQSLTDKASVDGIEQPSEGARVEIVKPTPKRSDEQQKDAKMPSNHRSIEDTTVTHQQAVATAVVSPGEKPGDATGAFRPVPPHRHPQPPINLAIQGDRPVSSGFVVQTAVSSPMSPTNRPAHQQENMVPSSQKVIQKLPHYMLDHHPEPMATTTATTTEHGEIADSAQFRRGATGGNAYHPQRQQQPHHHHQLHQHQQPSGSGGIVRSPSGRATRPDILDALQEQLSASSRELRLGGAGGGSNVMQATISPPIHQAIGYSKGPSPQGGHISLGQPLGRRSNMSPAERRIRNRTVGAEPPHAFAPVGDFTTSAVSPGLNYSGCVVRSGAPLLQQPQPQHYQQQVPPGNKPAKMYSQNPSSRRPPPPPPPHSSASQNQGFGSYRGLDETGGAPRSKNVAVIDVRDDMAPSIMRNNNNVAANHPQQMPSPSGLTRSQTVYFPVDSSNNFKPMGDGQLKMPMSSKSNNGGSYNAAATVQPYANGPAASQHNPSNQGKGRSSRHRRDHAAGRHERQSNHQPIEQSADESLDTMTDNDLMSCCRRQRDEIRMLRRQMESKDQVIHRLESEMRHLVHQMQQRYGGVIGGAGAQALAAAVVP